MRKPVAAADLRAAYLHVIDAHRWLATAGCSWNDVGPQSANGSQAVDKPLPNIIVAIQDSVLARARSLIDFYSKLDSDETDILLVDFGLSLDEATREKLAKYKKPIEVHLLHLTHWRTTEFREEYAVGTKANRIRPDWNHDTTVVAELVLDALRKAFEQSSNWQQPFRHLYEACMARYRSKAHQWPADLGEKDEVERFLVRLGR